jgi:hypothetical protein
MTPKTCSIALAGAFAATLLAACGGSSGPQGASGACASITGGLATVEATGDVTRPAAAADGDFASHASASFTPLSQFASITATAQPGVVYPAGSVAGAFIHQLNQGTASSTTITTLLDGQPVDSSSPASNAHDGDFSGVVASAPFDAVRVSFTDTGEGAGADYRVFEICSDR